MKVVILCGGLGTRLREETEFKPKPMVEIGERPILWHIMKLYSNFNYYDFILALGYKGDIIRDYFLHYEVRNRDFTITLGKGDIEIHGGHDEEGWRVTLAETGATTLTGGRLKRLAPYLQNETFMATYGDGVADTVDLCPNTPMGTNVSNTGCPLFTLPANNFTVEVISETCPGKNNGQIKITAVTALNYTTTINNVALNFTSTTATSANLAPGTYNFCIGVSGQTYTQCYVVQVAAGTTVSAKSNVVSGKASVEIEKGTAPFTVFVNGQEQFETFAPIFSIEVKSGDVLEVKTAVSCEGIYSKTIDAFDSVFAYPNPTQGAFEITVSNSLTEVVVELYNINSQLISTKKYPVVYGKIQLNLANKPIGVYIAKVLLDQTVTLKIIKQ